MLYELKKIRKAKGLNQAQAAAIFETPLGTYRNWEQCINIPKDKTMLKRIADYFEVPIEALFGYDLVEPGALSEVYGTGDEKIKYLPLVADVAAGLPVEPDEVLGSVAVPADLAGRHPHAFLLRVNGTSMNRILPEGCYALVDPDRRGTVIENKPYVVKINGDMATVKRLRRLADGWLLVPDSYDDSWQPIAMREGDPLYEEMRIAGEVVWYTLPTDWSF